jgi:hypothetical protein
MRNDFNIDLTFSLDVFNTELEKIKITVVIIQYNGTTLVSLLIKKSLNPFGLRYLLETKEIIKSLSTKNISTPTAPKFSRK